MQLSSRRITWKSQRSVEITCIYKKVLKPVIALENLLWNDYVMVVYLCDDSEQVVGHLSIELSFLMCKFISHENLAHMKLNVGEVMLRNKIHSFKSRSNYVFCILQPQLV